MPTMGAVAKKAQDRKETKKLKKDIKDRQSGNSLIQAMNKLNVGGG